MFAKHPGIVLIAAAITACGTSNQPENKVMATETAALEALTSDHPERACKYLTSPQACLDSVATARAMGLDVTAVLGVPDDWRSRLEKSRVTVNGATATLSAGPAGKTVHFVRRGNRWLVQN